MADAEDPLGLKELALNYDYLVFKINDYIANLSQVTYDAVSSKEKLVKQDYLTNQLHLTDELQSIDELLRKCNELELEFIKVDQLKLFVEDFKQRLFELETEYQKM